MSNLQVGTKNVVRHSHKSIQIIHTVKFFRMRTKDSCQSFTLRLSIITPVIPKIFLSTAFYSTNYVCTHTHVQTYVSTLVCAFEHTRIYVHNQNLKHTYYVSLTSFCCPGNLIISQIKQNSWLPIIRCLKKCGSFLDLVADLLSLMKHRRLWETVV